MSKPTQTSLAVLFVLAVLTTQQLGDVEYTLATILTALTNQLQGLSVVANIPQV